MFVLHKILLASLIQQVNLYWLKWQHHRLLKVNKTSRIKLIETCLDKLCIEAKLNGLNTQELSQLILPQFDNELAATDKKNLGRFCLKKFSNRKKCFVTMLLAMLLALFIMFNHSRPIQRLSLKYGRHLLFKLEPYWNWSNVYYSRCLIPKPVYHQTRSSVASSELNQDEMCNYCETIHQIPATLNLSLFNFDQAKQDEYLTFQIVNKVPIIYEDNAMLSTQIKSWTIWNKFSGFESIKAFYLNNANKRREKYCMFKSSLVSASNPTQLFVELGRFAVASSNGWYAHWENCDTGTMKSIRSLYTRPAILPAMVELSKPNWILLSSRKLDIKSVSDSDPDRHKSRFFRTIRPAYGTDLLVIVQLFGSIQLKLKPHRFGCSNKICTTLDAIELHQNQLAIVNAKYWTTSYQPMTDFILPKNQKFSNQFSNGTVNGTCYDDNSGKQSDINLTLVLCGVHV